MTGANALHVLCWSLALALGLNLALTTTQSTNPLVTPVWRSGEYFAKALWRLLLLLLVKLSSQTDLELKVCPSAFDVLAKLVVIRVQVFVMLGVRLQGVNIGDNPRHISLCRARTIQHALEMKEYLETNILLDRSLHGMATRPTAEQLSICKTSRHVDHMDELAARVRELVCAQYLPDGRNFHVSL